MLCHASLVNYEIIISDGMSPNHETYVLNHSFNPCEITENFNNESNPQILLKT